MYTNADYYKFVIRDLVKQSAPGRKQPELILPVFKEDNRVCIYSVLRERIEHTLPYRGGVTRLFLSFVKPFQAVSKDTISCWIKTVMIQSGIDFTVFKPHSTRAASTSKANYVRQPWMLFPKRLCGKEIVLSASLITNPLKIMSLSLARLFLVLARQGRPFFMFAMFSFDLNKLILHLLVIMGVISLYPYFKSSWSLLL